MMQPSWGVLQSVAWAADGKSFFATTLLPESFNLVRVDLSGKAQLLLGNGHKQFMFWSSPFAGRKVPGVSGADEG
jgi:hypothetical protein